MAIKGQYYSLSYAAKKLGNITSISLSIDGNQINISNFDSGEFEEFISGRKNVTMSVSTQYDMTDTEGQLKAVDDLLAGNSGEWVFGPETPVEGDVTFTGNGAPSNVSIEAPDEDVMTLSCDIQISGALTKSVEAAA